MTWDVKKCIIYNEGVGGTYPGIKLYNFENRHLSEWPNVISIEYGINSDPDYRSIESIDSIIYFLKRKYQRKNLDIPYFMFLEFHTIGYAYHDLQGRPSVFYPNYIKETENLTVIELNPNITWLTPSSPGLNRQFARGSGAGMFILELARFHQAPFFSAKDALFPSFTRFFATHPVTDKFPLGGNISSYSFRKQIIIP